MHRRKKRSQLESHGREKRSKKGNSDKEIEDSLSLSSVSSSSDQSTFGFNSLAAQTLSNFVKRQRRRRKVRRRPKRSKENGKDEDHSSGESSHGIAVEDKEEGDDEKDEEEEEEDTGSEGDEDEDKEAFDGNEGEGNQESSCEEEREEENSQADSKGSGRDDVNRSFTEFDEAASLEESAYFSAHANRNAKTTSDRTLNKLCRKPLSIETVKKSLAACPDPFAKQKQAIRKGLESCFDDWMTQMSHGFNVLVYGLGSKINLLQKFCKEFLDNRCFYLTVNGYFPGISVKEVLQQISNSILMRPLHGADLFDQCHSIEMLLEERKTDIYLVIHSIDGAKFQNEKSQKILSLLAKMKYVHVLASVSHVNAALLWGHVEKDCFNWICYDGTTYEPHDLEMSYENSLLVQDRNLLALNSIEQVLKSLTPNGRGVFLLLCTHQLEQQKQTYQGLALPELYHKCRETFLVSSMPALKAQLTEFRDHKLMQSRKSAEGIEMLTIPVASSVLEQIVDEFST